MLAKVAALAAPRTAAATLRTPATEKKIALHVKVGGSIWFVAFHHQNTMEYARDTNMVAQNLKNDNTLFKNWWHSAR